MPCSAPTSGSCIRSWLRDYGSIQSMAMILLYAQIACALVGSVGAMYNGLALANLAVSLFALVAIESSSQVLGRTYAVLLAASVVLDVVWFILYSHNIWNISGKHQGRHFVFSIKLTLWMQIVGFSLRSLSSVLWFQMYRLGVSGAEIQDVRSSFLNPTPDAIARRNCSSAGITTDTVHDLGYYSSLFDDTEDQR